MKFTSSSSGGAKVEIARKYFQGAVFMLRLLHRLQTRKNCLSSSFRWNNLLIIYRHPRLCLSPKSPAQKADDSTGSRTFVRPISPRICGDLGPVIFQGCPFDLNRTIRPEARPFCRPRLRIRLLALLMWCPAYYWWVNNPKLPSLPTVHHSSHAFAMRPNARQSPSLAGQVLPGE